ncbi:hypothetical protein ACN28S_31300 [Cystobacter fuscus]
MSVRWGLAKGAASARRDGCSGAAAGAGAAATSARRTGSCAVLCNDGLRSTPRFTWRTTIPKTLTAAMLNAGAIRRRHQRGAGSAPSATRRADCCAYASSESSPATGASSWGRRAMERRTPRMPRRVSEHREHPCRCCSTAWASVCGSSS